MSNDPASTAFQLDAEDALTASTRAVETEVVAVMVDRLASLSPEDSLADALSNAPADLMRIERALERGADGVSAATEALMDEMSAANEAWGAPMFEAAGVAYSAEPVAAIVSSGKAEAVQAVRARLSTSVIGLATHDGVLPLREAYTAIVSRAAADMVIGAASGQNAVSYAVSEALGHLCGNGVRVMYASGATRDVTAAVRQSVMSTYRKTMHDARWEMGRQFGADGVEVSAHGICAPDHLPYQGRQMSLKAYEAVNASLDRPLVDGANCRHIAFPVLLGVSPPAYSEAELDELVETSQREVTVTGLSGRPLTMTRYEATQYQRKLETMIRKERMTGAMMERAGLDPAESKARVRALQSRYRAVSNEAELVTRGELTRVRLPF